MRFFVLIVAFALAPAAVPAQQPPLRVWAFTGMQPVVLRWEAAYTRLHPEAHFTNTFHGPAAVMAGLYNGVADVAIMGRELWPVETMAYHWVFQRQPFGVAVVTSGLRAPAQAFTPVVVVNRANPLTSISPGQLDAIFGSEHRAAAANARAWGDLGLSGAWAERTIHPFGYGPEDALGVFFRHDVLKSDFKPNPESHLLSDRDAGPGARSSAAGRIAAAVATDPAAIGYTSAAAVTPQLKVIPVEDAAGHPVPATEQSIGEHTYPLTRELSLFVARERNKPLPAPVDEFVRFVLSPGGQAQVHPAEGFLPLGPELARRQLDRLDAPMPPEPKAAAADGEEKE